MERLVLFNDDTLYNITGLRKEAYYLALTDMYGHKLNDVKFDTKIVQTKTPTEVITGILKSKGYEGNPISMAIHGLLNMYQDRLRELLAIVKNHPDDFLKPGVVDLLKELKGQRIDRGFFSSGYEDIVKKTMESLDLSQYFCVSNFYSDRDRTWQHVAESTIANWRISHEKLLDRSEIETTLVGNSPDDVEVVKNLEGNVKLIAVANGAYKLPELFKKIEKSGLQRVYCVNDFGSYRDNARFITKDA